MSLCLQMSNPAFVSTSVSSNLPPISLLTGANSLISESYTSGGFYMPGCTLPEVTCGMICAGNTLRQSAVLAVAALVIGYYQNA
jgi:hypothetical protein